MATNPPALDAFFTTVLAQAIQELRKRKLPVYTFALYHDHESKAVEVCVDTREASARHILHHNAYWRKHFVEHIREGDLKEAASWQGNHGRSQSLGDFAAVNIARTDLPKGMRPSKAFYLAMIQAVMAKENEILKLAENPGEIMFYCSSADSEIGYTWAPKPPPRRTQTMNDDVLKKALTLLNNRSSPKKGTTGVDAGWFNIAKLDLPDGFLWIGDPQGSFGDVGDLEELQMLPRGMYDVSVQLVSFGKPHLVARLRVCQEGVSNPTLGEVAKKVSVDSAAVGVANSDALEAAFNRRFDDNENAALKFLERYVYNNLGLQLINGPDDAGIIYTNSGFGDGGYPLHKLMSDGRQVGVEVVFIQPSDVA